MIWISFGLGAICGVAFVLLLGAIFAGVAPRPRERTRRCRLNLVNDQKHLLRIKRNGYTLINMLIMLTVLALSAAFIIGIRRADKNYSIKFHAAQKANQTFQAAKMSEPLNELATKVKNRDGAQFIGVYLGMIAEWDGCTNGIWPNTNNPPYQEGVMMYSATSGQLLRWIPFDEFWEVYIAKTKREYP